MRYSYLNILLLLFLNCNAFSQTTDSLRQKIQKVLSTKKATVGVSIIGNNDDSLSINGTMHFPMQSVFKFHIAIAVLSQIDKGIFSLDQKLKIEKKDILQDLHSPLRNKYPNGGNIAISEILKYTVSESDNAGCDILLRLIGGPKVVEEYFVKNNFKDVSIKINEEVQQKNWSRQFENWTTPKATNEVLLQFYNNKTKLLSKRSYDFLWKIMKETSTGKARIKGQLPVNTVLAHKTGSSGANKEGITAAVNDMGIVFLPNGNYFYISVFVTNSTENSDTNEKTIADISKITWDYFSNAKK
jgi:beta-lactamase class A/beta-lactamase class A VEB